VLEDLLDAGAAGDREAPFGTVASMTASAARRGLWIVAAGRLGTW
jgi:hypothetical protein